MREFSKILIANRGEIAVRVARTARDLGYGTVAVFSDMDAHALHVQVCDEAVRIGLPAVLESYLHIERILDAARRTGADAIHPGYGFLSENARFAQACEAAGIVFIGPPVSAIHLMGSKRLSKIAMREAGLPCVEGYDGAAQDDVTLLREAERVGLPLMVKASAGGGGRGMRLVTERNELLESIRRARSEASSAFGSGELILERAVLQPRHIEIQVFADMHEHCVYLGERDCSIQRRHQKVLEEAPSSFVTPELREHMGAAAVAAARRCKYVGAGTVEFLVDAERNFYFLEMNTRLQVEHPVTEMVTGLDLVEWQLRVAAGEPLPLTQREVAWRGHAIEVRLYAEDPRNGFLPQTGLVERFEVPQLAGVRVDAGIASGQRVSAFYDPMLAKVIAHGPDRHTAARRLARALEEMTLLGVTSNRAFLADIVRHPAFVEGRVTTAFITEHMDAAPSLRAGKTDPDAALAAAMLIYCAGRAPFEGWSDRDVRTKRVRLEDQDQQLSIVELMQVEPRRFKVSIEGHTRELQLISLTATAMTYELDGVRRTSKFLLQGTELWLDWRMQGLRFSDRTLAPAARSSGAVSGEIRAPMDGSVIAVACEIGAQVKRGEVLIVIEAMKMETQLRAPFDGTVASLAAARGQQVKARQALVSVSEKAAVQA